MDLREIGLEGVDWIHLAQYTDPVVGPCAYSNEPSSSMKGQEFSV